MTNLEKQREKATIFAQLHNQPQPLVLPNVWDPLGAALIEKIGFPAVATSSSALALTHGYQDGENIPFEEHLEVLKKIAESVSLPVTADVEAGYASSNEQLKKNIAALIDSGIVGINFEDSDKKTHQLIPIEKQQEKLQIIRQVSDEKGIHLFINARIDTYVATKGLTPDQQLKETIKRGEAYKAAGADGLFPILISDQNHIKQLIDSVGLPVNVLSFPPAPDFYSLKELGVARISVGGSLLKVAFNALKDQAELLLKYEGKNELENSGRQLGFDLSQLIKHS